MAARPCRFSVLIAALGAFVFLKPDQTAESLAALCDRQAPWAVCVFVLATLGWAFTSWYFARVMLRFAYPDRADLPRNVRPVYRAVAVGLPRLLGVTPLAVVAGAFFRSADRTRAVFPPAIAVSVLTVAFGAFLVSRKALLEKIRDFFAGRAKGSLVKSVWRDLDQLYEPKLNYLRELPEITIVVLSLHVAISLLLLVGFTIGAVPVAQWLGAPTVLATSLSSWIAAGSALSYLSSWLRLPLLLFLAIEAVLVSPWADDHVAASRPAHDTYLSKRNDIKDDFARWRSATSAGPSTPYILVSAEGGGIRAAYWTAAVLTALQDRYRAHFASRVYAISSVSGGSLGAAVFDALIADGTLGDLQKASAEILSLDSLAPPLGKLLYPEVVQRFLPLGVPQFDRGAALERSWTLSVGSQVGRNIFAAPFDGIWNEHSPLPRLFLNSTWVETGKRVVLSYPKPDACLDTVDGDTLASFTLAQAVHASARFPYISPAATILASDGEAWGHLVDGGYFENSGAATAAEILDKTGNRHDARILIIRYCDDVAKNGPPAARWATELTAPPLGLFDARDARGTLALAALRESGPEVAEFCLHPAGWRSASPGPFPPLPLGWMLSASARTEINRQVDLALADASPPAETVRAWMQ